MFKLFFSFHQNYLSEKSLIHRDLAARNILVAHGKKLKIADFGLMREMYHEVYEVKKQKKLPIKWMAPESIYEQMFSSQSHVYVFRFSNLITLLVFIPNTFKVLITIFEGSFSCKLTLHQ